MTVAAISFDQFLFIVKPHLHKWFMRPLVALTLTIGIWILAAPLSIFHFNGFDFQYSLDFCTLTSSSIGPIIYTLLLAVILLGIIFVTSVWTFCFTCRFINNQSVTAGESVYASRKKRLFGIFGSMLLVYIICFIPVILEITCPEMIGLTVLIRSKNTDFPRILYCTLHWKKCYNNDRRPFLLLLWLLTILFYYFSPFRDQKQGLKPS